MLMDIHLLFDYRKGQTKILLLQKHNTQRKPLKLQVIASLHLTNCNTELFFHTKLHSRSQGPTQSLEQQAAPPLGNATLAIGFFL